MVESGVRRVLKRKTVLTEGCGCPRTRTTATAPASSTSGSSAADRATPTTTASPAVYAERRRLRSQRPAGGAAGLPGGTQRPGAGCRSARSSRGRATTATPSGPRTRRRQAVSRRHRAMRARRRPRHHARRGVQMDRGGKVLRETPPKTQIAGTERWGTGARQLRRMENSPGSRPSPNARRSPRQLEHERFFYRKLNSNSMVLMIATGSPNRVPGRKRHCRAALIASSSSPNTGSSERVIRTSPTVPSGSTTAST